MRVGLAVIVCGLLGLVGCGRGSSNGSNQTPPKPPVANAGGPYTGTAGTAVSFSGAGSTDPQGEALTYAWNFGDGNTGTGVSPSHTYATPGSYAVTLTVTNTSNLSATATATVIVPNGRVYGGAQPIAGAHVYLFAANTIGYGQASVSLLSAAATGMSDAVGGYVLTNSDGSFVWAGSYTCTPGTQVYAYARGGSSGEGTNPASGLLAVLGACPSSGNFSAIPYLTVNEVSTVVAAYAFAGFATDATHVSSSGTALAKVGVANAFANAVNLATLGTGVALATTPAGNGVVPQAELNTLANILAACVETGGPGANGCSLLFSNAMSNGSSGTAPTDTATAAINIAHHPGTNVTSLYGLSPGTPPYVPKLTAQPNDFTVSLNFIGGGLNAPGFIAIDASGNVWVTNSLYHSITEFSNSGIAISPASGYTGGGLNDPEGIAIDASGNVWIANYYNSISEFSNSGVAISPSGGYTGGGLNAPYGIAIDASGNVWVTNFYNSISELSNSGVAISPTGGYTGGGLNDPEGIAIDASGNVWVTNFSIGISKFSNSGVAVSSTGGYTGGGLSEPVGIAIDALGNIWVANVGNTAITTNISEFSNSAVAVSPAGGYTGGGLFTTRGIAIDGSGDLWATNGNNSISAFSNSGVAVSPSRGFTGGGLDYPVNIAVDGSGNVWVANTGVSIAEVVGAATPVVTPLAAGVKNNTLGTRP